MALMTVDKDPNGDFRSKERWSANRKLDVVLRLLRGEKLEDLSREVGIESWAHVAKVGNRFAALQPVYDAVIDRFGTLEPDIARGIMLRHDWGSQYRAHHFQGSLTWLGIADDAAFVGEPRGIGVAERFIRTREEQCLWARLCDDRDELRQAVAAFIETYNNEWLIERLGHRTPRDAFNDATAQVAA
jgi:putative transposase